MTLTKLKEDTPFPSRPMSCGKKNEINSERTMKSGEEYFVRSLELGSV